MIIKGVAASLPERRVTNEELIEMVREQSAPVFKGDLDRTLRVALALLKRTGLVERRWCGIHESPLDHVAIAVREAMSHAYLRREHIELVVYVGVGRGFIEPGNSHMIANALGLRNAQCFDVTDACMSWLRALEMIDGLFKMGRYRNALVINAEFHSHEGGMLMPNCLRISSEDEVAFSFPAWTIGNAATATLLSPKEPDNFRYFFRSDVSLSALCTIPIPGFEEYCHPDPAIGTRGALEFTSYGSELHKQAMPQLVDLWREGTRNNTPEIVFIHASSKREWDRFAKEAGASDKIFHIFPMTGNLVSASVPAAMAEAIRQEQLSRGMRVGAWIGSAGMSFGYSGFRY